VVKVDLYVEVNNEPGNIFIWATSKGVGRKISRGAQWKNQQRKIAPISFKNRLELSCMKIQAGVPPALLCQRPWQHLK